MNRNEQEFYNNINRIANSLEKIAKNTEEPGSFDIENREEESVERFLSAEDILVAVDQTVVSSDFLVRPGSEVAFFPPVTGG